MGKVKLYLYDDTPLHRDNFVKLARAHYFDGTLFHRVIPSFMVQAGDPDSKKAAPGQLLGNGDLGYKVPAEIKPSRYHKRGVLAAARDGNPEKASSACQFYITVGKPVTDDMLDNIERGRNMKYDKEQRATYKEKGGTPNLDGNYTVFGEITEGMEVVDRIVSAERDKSDRPLKDIPIEKLRVKKKFLFFWL